MALTVHVWSDVVCPWCFIGKRRFEKAVREFGQPVEIEWHSFELDPRPAPAAAPRSSYVEMLTKKFGSSEAQVRGMLEQMTKTGAADGISFDFSRAVPAHTFDAHRLIQLARARDKQDAIEERLFRAHFEEGVDVASTSELVRLAGEIGLDPDEAASVLASDDLGAAVREDEEQARALGVSGVPFFVIGRYGISGAQKPETFVGVLDRAFAEEPAPMAAEEQEEQEGAFCGPDGC